MSFSTTRGSRAFCIFVFVCLASAVAFASEKPERLPQDPANVYGVLSNGFRYIIRAHKQPPGRVGLYLHVSSGALHETESQNGLAHFLEHMAFNGSEHYPPGTLITLLQQLGMSFGADTNAHTNLHETVYKLLMPDTNEPTIDKALSILRDYAAGLSLTTEEIDKERGIILEEARSHWGPEQRLMDEVMKRVFPGTRIAEHTVIGKNEQIATFPREEFVDYWNTWYRPERMTLIIVGEIDPDAMRPKIDATFGKITARAPARDEPGAGLVPITETRAVVLADKEQREGEVRLMSVLAGRAVVQTYPGFHLNEVENMGTWIMSRRLDDLEQTGEASYLSANVRVQSLLEESIQPYASASGEPARWNAMLAQLITEIKRATKHGFTPREVELAKREIIADAERAVEVESTRDARAILGRLSRLVGEKEPILSATQRLELIRRVAESSTAEEIHKVFVQNYGTGHYTYVILLPEGPDIPTTEKVLAVAQAAWGADVTKHDEEAKELSILEKKPEAGSVASQVTDEASAVTTVTFGNGVILHHRFMSDRKDQVWVQISLPGGEIEETAENRGVSRVAGLANATSRLSSSQIRDLMTGVNVRVGGTVGVDTASLSLSGSPKDLEKGFELAHAFLTDPKIEATAFATWRETARQEIDAAEWDPIARGRKAVAKLLYGGDVRFMPLEKAQLDPLTPAAGEAWLRRIARQSPIEVGIVGDLPLARAIELAASYLGSLPKPERNFQALNGLRKITRPDGPYAAVVDVDTITDKALVSAGFIGCDDRSVADRRALSVASRILTERMRAEIREKRGLVYSIGCVSLPSKEIPGCGLLFAGVPTDPKNTDALADAIQEIMKQLTREGPTATEMDVAHKQIAHDVEIQLREPSYWLLQLSDLVYRGRPLKEIVEIQAAYAAITGDQVKETLGRYVRDDRAVRVIARPTVRAGGAANPETPRETGKPEKAGARE